MKLRERGVERLTVQGVCRVARDEAQVRETRETLLKDPERAGEIVRELRAENEYLYKFGKMPLSGDMKQGEARNR